MIISTFITSNKDTIEIPEVQLACERGELRLIEESWQDNFGALVQVMDYKLSSMWEPTDDFIEITSTQYLH